MKKIKCSYCDEKAIYETRTNNIYLCEKNECKIAYVEEIIIELED